MSLKDGQSYLPNILDPREQFPPENRIVYTLNAYNKILFICIHFSSCAMIFVAITKQLTHFIKVAYRN